MRVSAASPRGRPPGTQGHLSQQPWQIHAKAPPVGQKIGTNTPTPGATWATYYKYLKKNSPVLLAKRYDLPRGQRGRRMSIERACLSCGENRWTLRQQITCKSRGYGPGVFCQKRKSALMPHVWGMPLLQIPCQAPGLPVGCPGVAPSGWPLIPALCI